MSLKENDLKYVDSRWLLGKYEGLIVSICMLHMTPMEFDDTKNDLRLVKIELEKRLGYE